MTTRINVDAHAGWDVEVVLVYIRDGYSEHRSEVVPKMTSKDFYIHSHMQLASVKELKSGE